MVRIKLNIQRFPVQSNSNDNNNNNNNQHYPHFVIYVLQEKCHKIDNKVHTTNNKRRRKAQATTPTNSQTCTFKPTYNTQQKQWTIEIKYTNLNVKYFIFNM